MSLFSILSQDDVAKFQPTDDKLMADFVRANRTDLVTKAFETGLPINYSELLSIAVSKEMVFCLLRNIPDFGKCTFSLSCLEKLWIVEFLLDSTVSDTNSNENILKNKIDPNQPINDYYKTSFWRKLVSNETVKLGLFREFTVKNKNFNADLDINSKNKDGNTYLHNCNTFYPEMIALNPDINLKNRAGETVEYCRRSILSDDEFRKYAESKKTPFATSSGSTNGGSGRDSIARLQALNDALIAELNEKNLALKKYEEVHEKIKLTLY